MPLATTHDTVILQEAITKITTTVDCLLATSLLLQQEMRKVDDHNVSLSAHPDLRSDILYVRQDLNTVLPNWDANGNYQGPVGVGIRDDIVVGIEFISAEQLAELTTP